MFSSKSDTEESELETTEETLDDAEDQNNKKGCINFQLTCFYEPSSSFSGFARLSVCLSMLACLKIKLSIIFRFFKHNQIIS